MRGRERVGPPSVNQISLAGRSERQKFVRELARDWGIRWEFLAGWFFFGGVVPGSVGALGIRVTETP